MLSAFCNCHNYFSNVNIKVIRHLHHSTSMMKDVISIPEKKKVALIACGSFNPPTYMHLRMMERAKDYLIKNRKNLTVIAGYLSPVSDGYKKPGLASAFHRQQMLRIALNTVSDQWIKTSEWESSQVNWSPTINVLNYNKEIISKENNEAIQVMLVCGGDFLQSFTKEGLWKKEDIEYIIINHGIIVVTRPNYNCEDIISGNSLLTKLRSHIFLTEELFVNDLSSTAIRKAVRNHDSINYLTPSSVVDYIKQNELYSTEPKDKDSVLAPYLLYNKQV